MNRVFEFNSAVCGLFLVSYRIVSFRTNWYELQNIILCFEQLRCETDKHIYEEVNLSIKCRLMD